MYINKYISVKYGGSANNLEAPPIVDNLEAPPIVDNLETPPIVDNLEAPPIVDNLEAPPIVDNLEAPPIQPLYFIITAGATESGKTTLMQKVLDLYNIKTYTKILIDDIIEFILMNIINMV